METTTQQVKHTPGPWHVGLMNGEGSVFADEGRMRAEAGGTTLYPICSVIDFDGEREANARLIAAAPELLAALQRLTIQAEMTDDYEQSIGGTLHGAIKQANAAIAKATT